MFMMNDLNLHRDGNEPIREDESIAPMLIDRYCAFPNEVSHILTSVVHKVLNDAPIMVKDIDTIRFWIGNILKIEVPDGPSIPLNEAVDHIDLRASRSILNTIEQDLEILHLELDLLLFLSDRATENICKEGASSLSFKRLSILTKRQATLLAQSRASSLALDGLKSISDDVAVALGGFRGEKLSLRNLRTLSETQAAGLGAFGGKKLLLERLVGVTDRALHMLSDIPDVICMPQYQLIIQNARKK
jgi:hypothetical protein